MLNLNGTGTFVYVTEKILPEIDADDDSLVSTQAYLNYIGAQISTSSFIQRTRCTPGWNPYAHKLQKVGTQNF